MTICIDSFKWTPTEKGNYKVIAKVVDKLGFKISYTKQFTVT